MGDKAAPGLRFSPRPNRAAEIPWQLFGPEAFETARRLRRPVLLAIGAVWCHWCHVMDEGAYSDERVLETVRDRYVAVRVDRDQRPDVDRRYNQGGWPTTCLLNASGSVLWGGTYVPAERFVEVLSRVADAYAADPGLADAVPPVAGHAASAGPGHGPTGALASPGEVVDDVLGALARLEDRRFGGFGHEGPKFPQVESLAFLSALAPWPDGRGEVARGMLARALDGMLAGDLEDRHEGGFYRYATRPDWREPHYEKMLWDNAHLASIYLRAGARSGEARWLAAGRAAIGFLQAVLWQDGVGAYAMSQDADEAYARLDVAGRRGRRAPFVDTVVYADANLAMVETLLDAWAILGEAALRGRALALWDGLVERLYRPGVGFGHFDAGTGPGDGREVMDQVLALGAARALLPFGRVRDLELARALADDLLASGAASGRLREALAGWEGPESWRRAPSMPLAAESGRAALQLLGLGRRLADARYGDAARRLVEALALEAGRLGPFAADVGRAAAAWRAPVTVQVALGPGDAGTSADLLLAGARRAAIEPMEVVRVAAAERAALGLVEADGTLAYACLGTVCAAPAAHPAELVESLRHLVARAPAELVW